MPSFPFWLSPLVEKEIIKFSKFEKKKKVFQKVLTFLIGKEILNLCYGKLT